MNDKRFAIVVTTINVPRLLPDYLANFRANGWQRVEIIVIADRNTPAEAEAFCRGLDGVDYWSPARQQVLLREFPRLGALLPWRSIQRRNLGYLVAYRGGADVIVSMDDDNFLHEADHLAGHRQVGETARVRCVAGEDGFWNVCSLLRTEPPRRFYHRGFPVSKRWASSPERHLVREGRVAVNAGLWLGDPDVDTVTRLEEPFQVRELVGDGEPVGLDRGTFSPFNSQNTAAIRDLLPFLYLVVAGASLRGHRSTFANFRYDDIWMSYLAKPALDRMGDIVTFGRPLVVQRRNPHDLLTDLDREIVPMMLTERLIEILRGIELRGSSYLDLYGELVEALRAGVGRDAALTDAERAFLFEVTDGMEIWAEVCAAVISEAPPRPSSPPPRSSEA
jgi:glycosyltransferase involved in cell wall biosynthesis